MKYTTSQYIQKAISVHGSKYTYSNSIYTGSHKKILITCLIHGDFLQSANSHLQGYGCRKCQTDSQRIDINEFIKRSISTHGDKYNYSKSLFIDTNTKVNIECPIHGEFYQLPSDHFNGRGCNKCGGTSIGNTDDFIKKAKLIHGNKYIYDKVKYKSAKSNVLISCRTHGDFLQMPNTHLNGGGCRKCSTRTNFSKSSWINFSNKNQNSDPKVYIIRCFNKNEEFVKIGITYTSIAKRFSRDKLMPYSYEVIKEIKGSADFVWDKEKDLHRKYKSLKYKPQISFAGQTECFTIEILNSLPS